MWLLVVKIHFFVPMKRTKIVFRKNGFSSGQCSGVPQCNKYSFGGRDLPRPLGSYIASQTIIFLLYCKARSCDRVSFVLCPSVHLLVETLNHALSIYSVSKNPPKGTWDFHFFHKRFRIFNRFFTHLIYVPIYARLQTFFNYPRFWRSYLVLSATTQFT